MEYICILIWKNDFSGFFQKMTDKLSVRDGAAYFSGRGYQNMPEHLEESSPPKTRIMSQLSNKMNYNNNNMGNSGQNMAKTKH